MSKESFFKNLERLKDIFKHDDEALGAMELLSKKIKESDETLFKASRKDSKISSEQLLLPPEMRDFPQAYGLFCDGACRGNPGPGAWASLAQKSEHEILFEISGTQAHTTNNQMELDAAIYGLVEYELYFKSRQLPLGDITLLVFCDSKYVIEGISKWVLGWKKRGWRKADNKTPENLERWQRLDELNEMPWKLKFIWVKGHAGHPQNEFCDQLANQALDDM